MAEKVVSPGVFTNELDQSFLPAAIGDIGAAIIGPTAKGPAMVPTVVSSFSEFEQMFGTTVKSGSNYYSYLTSVAAQNYLRHGNNLTVVRILDGTFAPASASVMTAGTSTTGATFGSGSFTLVATDIEESDVIRVTNGSTVIDFVGQATPNADASDDSIRFFDRGSSVTDFAANFATEFNAVSSLGGFTAGNVAGLVQISGSSAGTGGNGLIVATGSGADFTTAFTTEGGTNTEGTATQAFTLHALTDGVQGNSVASSDSNTYGTSLTNNVLPSGSKDNLRFEITSKNDAKGTFTLAVRRGDDTQKRKQTLETWNNLSLDPTAPNYIEKIVGSQTFSLQTDGSTSYIQPSGDYPVKSKYVRVANVVQTPDYLNENGLLTDNAASASLPAVGSGSYDGGFEGGSDGTAGINGSRYTGDITAHFYENITAGNNTDIQGFDVSDLSNVNGGTAYSEALSLLANDDEYDINLLMLPGVTQDGGSAILSKAIDTCETRGDCFVIADPVGYGANIATAIGEAADYDSNYAAMYWPWVQVADNQLGRNVWVPPSVVLGGIYAFNDKVAHPWFAPAGLNRGGIDTAIQAERKLTHANRDEMYESNLNPIATFPGQGVTVFGQKTLQKKSSALDRVNVRRLMIKVKKFIAASSRFLVFEQNNSQTRRRFLNIANPYLEQVQSNSGLNAFRIVMDDTNNTPDVVDRNILFGQIFLQPTKTAEFIVLDFTIQPTGATFPE